MTAPVPGDARTAALVPLPRAAAPILVAFAATIAALLPLHEVDLAQHLATGEWIVRQRAVPFTEPFAWTREGQPYFAYSWLAQTLYYSLLHAFGPVALHLLEGVIAGGAVAAVLWAGSQFRWQPFTRLAVAVLHLALLWGVAGTLRPQQVFFITIPIIWGITARIHNDGVSVLRLVVLAGSAAITANSHIFFPITAAPILYFLAAHGPPRPWLLAGAALVIGWLLSPYALVWPDVFALNFGYNVLLDRPPSILEFVPGFEYAVQRKGVIVASAALVAAPWLVAVHRSSPRERVAIALFWTGGLILFAYAGRLVLMWWAFAFPVVGLAAERVVSAFATSLERPFGRAVALGVAAILLVAAAPPVSPIFWRFEGDTTHRMLPRGGEDPALWLPSWLLCNTRGQASGRIFTEFNYGSELTWRLPGYSVSIDGRTIFPDSVAMDFSFQPFGRRLRHATTWTSADLALLDRSFWLAPVLDADTAWLLLAQARPTSRRGFGALWARRAWWREWGRSEAAVPVLDIAPGDPRGICAATGTFPRPQ